MAKVRKKNEPPHAACTESSLWEVTSPVCLAKDVSFVVGVYLLGVVYLKDVSSIWVLGFQHREMNTLGCAR